MITLRAATIIILCFIIAVGTKCQCCNCDDRKVTYSYQYNDMMLAHLDNSGNDTIPPVNNTVNKEAYALRLDLFAVTSKLAAACPANFSFFINEANALSCDCIMAHYQGLHKVKSIRIIDLENADDAAAGSDVTDKFRYYSGFKNNSSEKKYIPVNEFLEHYFPYPTESYVPPIDGLISSSFLLFMMEPPASPGTHRFKVTITFDDNSVIEQTSEPITLQ